MGKQIMKYAVAALLALFIVVALIISIHDHAMPGHSATGYSATTGLQKGWLIMHGGGLLTDEVEKRFVALAGGPNAEFVVIPTADADENIDLEQIRMRASKGLGGRSVTVLHTRDRARANSADFVEPLRHATGVWIGGGRQWRLVDAYLGTAVEREIKALLARGGVVAGGSAGATIQGSFLVRGAPGTFFNPDGDNTIMIAPGYTTGFGLLPDSAIDQHINTRGREADLHQVIAGHPNLLGIGLSEGAAIVVHGNSFFVVGGQIAIHDGKDHSGLSYYFLRPGQAFDWKTRTAAADDSSLVFTMNTATRSTASAGIKTTGTGFLSPRSSPGGNVQEIQYECDVALYSVEGTAYAARTDGPHRIEIKVRDLDSDIPREYPCRY